MKLESLSLRRVTRFADTATLILRDLPSGLIALVGENGEGKTTTLEAPFAGLYRRFPSREREVFDYVTAADGFIETTFELEGHGLFRARLNLDGPHRKSEAVLAQIQPDGREVFLNDGKVSTFDAAVATLLPPPALLLASVFAAQNRAGSFRTLSRKDRQALFSTLLGNDHVQELSERAKAAVGLLQPDIDKLTAHRDVLARDAGETVEQELEHRAQQLQAEGGQIEVRRTALSRDIALIEADLTRLADSAAAHKAALQQIARLTADHHHRSLELAKTFKARDVFEEEVVAEDARLRAVAVAALTAFETEREDTSSYVSDVKEISESYAATIADADACIANNQKLLDQADGIRSAVSTVRQIDAALAELRASVDRELRLGEDLRARERALASSLAAIAQTEMDLRRSETDAALLSEVPCGGGGEFAECQFLTNALAARESQATLRAVVETKPTHQAEIAEHRDTIGQVARSIEKHRLRITELEQDRATRQPLAERLPKLTEAEARIALHNQRKRDAKVDADRLLAAAVTREERRLEDVQRRRADRQQEDASSLARFEQATMARRQTLAQDIATLESHIEALVLESQAAHATVEQHQADSARASELLADLHVRRREWDDTTQRLGTIAGQRAELERRVAQVRQLRAELATTDARLRTLRADVVEWGALAKGLGRDGLQVLEIDAAGPTVSAFTNDLLQTCFGSARFTVDLVTQEAKQSKGKDGSTMKDSFELKVFDSERGGESRDLSDLSGGEQILVDEALKSAIALLVNERHAHPIRTCWRDETTGALDPENAQRYLAMLRRVHELGRFHHTLFVTHNADAARQADAQVIVRGGRFEVRQAPYPEAA